MRYCTVPGCDRRHKGRGFCSVHLRRVKRYGDPLGSSKAWTRTLADGRVVKYRPLWPNVTFMSNVVEQDDGCWIWTGGRKPTGRGGDYGGMAYAGKPEGAHRVAWMLFRGPIPKGLTIDHLCEVKLCVNPLHLEPVTHIENVMRASRGASAVNRAKTHCIRGHAFDEENTLWEDGGVHRRCRTCKNEAQKRNRIKRLARAAA